MAFGFVTTLLEEAISRFIPVLMVLIVYYIIWANNKEVRISREGLFHIVGVCVFCFYLLIILCITGIPLITEVRFDSEINLIPFIDIVSHPIQYSLNVFIFLPLGVLLPLLWHEFDKIHLVILCGFLFSLSIELTQLLGPRVTDIDDLLTNTAGAAIGYIAYIVIKRIVPRISVFGAHPKGEANYWSYEVHLCFIITYLAMFLIPNFL